MFSRFVPGCSLLHHIEKEENSVKKSIRFLSIVVLAIVGLMVAIAPAQAQSDSTLTVDLSGTWNGPVSVELWNSDRSVKLWTLNNQHGAMRAYSVPQGTYDLKLVSGPQESWVDDIPCNSDCNANAAIQTLTVDLSGSWIGPVSVELYANDAGKIWTAYNQHGAPRTYNVLNGTYDLKLISGDQQLPVDNIDCTAGSGACNAGTVKQTLTVDLSGSWNGPVSVELYANDAGKIWTAYNQHGGTRNYNVLNGTYDLKLASGPHQMSVDNIDCTAGSGACNAGTVKQTLTVDLSGGWNSPVSVELYANDAGKVWTAYNQHGGTRNYNVLKGIYDLKVVQGPKIKDVADIDCSSGSCTAGDIVSQLTMNLAPHTGVTTKLHVPDGQSCTAGGGQIWTANNQSGTPNYNVLKNTYDVSLIIGGQTYIWDNVSCTGESCTPDKSTLTVNFPGINSVHTYIYNSDGVAGTVSGPIVTSQGYKNGQATFNNLPNGKYDVRIVQGGMVKIVDDVLVMGNCASVDNIVATMTVNFPGINSAHTYVNTFDNNPGHFTGSAVTSSAYKNDGTTLTVLRGVYDVKVVQGAQAYIVDGVDCSGGACSVSDIVSTMTVSFPGINSAHTYVNTNDELPGQFTGGAVTSSAYKNNGTTLTVLKGVYDVKVVQGAQAYIVDGVDCSDGACSVSDIVSTMTVNFPGLNSVHTYVKTDDNKPGEFTGGDVTSSAYKNNGTEIKVLKAFYDVKIVHGANSYLYDAVDCTGDTCVLDKASLTVNFPGINGLHVYLYQSNGVAGTVSGPTVTQQTHKNNLAVFNNLSNGKYDLRLVQGGMVKIIDDVYVLGNFASVNDIVATLTVKFPGINSVHTYVHTDDGGDGTFSGSKVTQTTHKNSEATLVVLKGQYDVKVVQGAQGNVYDVNCSSATCTIDNIVATLTVKFPGINSVHTYVKTDDGSAGDFSGGSVTQTTHKNSETTLVVLKGQYDVKVVQGAQGNVYNVDCTESSTCSIDNIVVTLTVNFPGINGVHTYVKTDDGSAGQFGGGSVTQVTHKNSVATLVVLKGQYDVKVVQGAQGNVYDVDCTESSTCSIDNIVATLTVNFPGINGVHTYVKTDGGPAASFSGDTVTQSTHKNNSVILAVLKGIYDVKVVKGLQTDYYDVECLDDTCSVGGGSEEIEITPADKS